MAKIKDELKDKINNTTLELKQDINDVKGKIDLVKTALGGVKDNFKVELGSVKDNNKAEFNAVKHKLNNHSKITTFVATFVVLIATGLFALYQDVSDTKGKISELTVDVNIKFSDMDKKISDMDKKFPN
jgi:hypothetical protein